MKYRYMIEFETPAPIRQEVLVEIKYHFDAQIEILSERVLTDDPIEHSNVASSLLPVE